MENFSSVRNNVAQKLDLYLIVHAYLLEANLVAFEGVEPFQYCCI